MRIPLDYYRILGLPIQATAEQLQQAHRDRTLQLPRREFSEAAIEARKQLIDEAYAVLSDPARRQDYDTTLLAKSYDLEGGRSPDFPDEGYLGNLSVSSRSDFASPDPYSPTIEIDDEQFVGALLILQELGEYELVAKLGRPYLDGSNLALKQGQFGDPNIISADVVLTVALSCLELGREQWQQGQYENAAESLKAGQDLLLREGFFPNLRGEMQADLYKLRPYRILELVALPEHQMTARRQGLALLEDMLNDRGGIDGSGDDQSGLTVDDFLRFIQQLRSYLTVSEQQTLFEGESRRPSAVAIYLAVYALLARGFAEREPALIRRAKAMLLRLGVRQDVHLEQAVCSLLLGQTEEASRALELSQEFESLTFIREHSQGSPDLLPGLCLYSERWLQNEVFPHFRDLARKQASLKEYFADEDVQAYLEELPNEPEPANPWATRRPAATIRQPVFESRSPESRVQTIGREPGQPTPSRPRTAIIDAPDHSIAASNGTVMPPAEPGTALVEDGRDEGYAATSVQAPQRHRSRDAVPSPRAGGGGPRRGGSSLRIDRLLLLAAMGAGVVLILFLLSRLFGGRPEPASTASDAPLQVEQLDPILSELINQQGQGVALSEPLDETNAASVIEAWLSAKSDAMGRNHEIEDLQGILTDPALEAWRARAQQARSSNSYWEYEHSDVEVISVEVLSNESGVDASDTGSADDGDGEPTDREPFASDTTPNGSTSTQSGDPGASDTSDTDVSQEAIVEATVSEKGAFYNNGQLDESSSYDSTLQVRYSLVSQDGEWRIQSWEVLE